MLISEDVSSIREFLRQYQEYKILWAKWWQRALSRRHEIRSRFYGAQILICRTGFRSRKWEVSKEASKVSFLLSAAAETGNEGNPRAPCSSLRCC